MERKYIAIDLKSFYASVECMERGLDPMRTNLVVADSSRTEKTICLAVSPSLKKHGISGRARLFEVVEKVREANERRRLSAPYRRLVGESYDDGRLSADPALAISYIVAPPRMAKYMDISTKIYSVYLKYVSKDDIHVYSIDEVFIDVTHYLSYYKLTAHDLALRMIRDVLTETGITATAGIGTNLYLAKVAMDIMAKKMTADSDGVRIAELDERSYREQLWSHTPLTAFWRVGRGYAERLEQNGMYTMGDVALCSLHDEDLLYRLFGVNAELLIDHAWGHEPCLISDIKRYRPQSGSLSTGQVLSCAYPIMRARLIVREMVDLLVLDLVEKQLLTDQIVLDIGYDTENLRGRSDFVGDIDVDRYGRRVPKASHGSTRLGRHTSSTELITDASMALFDRIVDRALTVRRVTVTACNTIDEAFYADTAYQRSVQLDLFTDSAQLDEEIERENESRRRERSRQEAIIELHRKFGKNSVLKGFNYEDGATTKERNKQIGGHKA